MNWFTDMDATLSPLNVLLIGVVCMCVCQLLSRRRNLPPGPRIRIPVFGNLLDVTPDIRDFLTDFRRRYGDVYSLFLGKHLTVVIAGYDAIKEAFHKRGDVFSDRHVNYLFDKVSDGGKGITFASGDRWKEHRGFAVVTLKEFGVGGSKLQGTILHQAELLAESIDRENGTKFDPRIRLQTCVSNIISSIAFGRQFTQGDRNIATLTECIHNNIADAGLAGIVQFIPELRFVPGDPFKIHATLRRDDTIRDFIVNIIEEHINKYDVNDTGDYIDAFLKEMKRKEGTDSTFTVDQLAQVIMDLFFAGTDTTSAALTWALLYLVNYPDVQDRMFREIEEHVVTDSFPTLHDKAKLPFTEAVYMEVLRHAELLCVSLPHTVPHDVMFRGFHLPKGVLILPDIHSVLKDPSIWDDPETFNPDRFIGDDGAVHKPEEFIPFFTGRRNCMGDNLAKMELFLFLAALVQRFEFRPPPGEDLSIATLDGVFGLVHSPRPFNVVAIRRDRA